MISAQTRCRAKVEVVFKILQGQNWLVPFKEYKDESNARPQWRSFLLAL
jgi:hypothetical protein